MIREGVNDGRQAVVRTSVMGKDGRDVRMDFTMGRAGERWRVHDVVINGVSLVDNYRAQFARVLRTAPLAANGQGRIVVEGHADGRGDSRSNEALAERRALAIREHLVTSGVDAGPSVRTTARNAGP